MTPSQAVARMAARAGLRVVVAPRPGEEVVLTPSTLALVEALVRAFGPRIDELLARRRTMQARFDGGTRPRFLEATRSIRESDWTVAPPPAELIDRRVELTGPVDRKMVINALNSGANAYMADFEDATAPTWDNIVEGQVNLFDAVRRTIRFDDPETGKAYRLGARTAVLMVRPRGLHLPEKHVEVDGRPIPACLWDFGIFAGANARELHAQGHGIYLYLPKLESHMEARLWNDVLAYTERALDLPRGSIRPTVLIETLPAAFEMDEILWELRERSLGLNCGRWDYIFSFIKVHRTDPGAVLPDRSRVTMDQGFLEAYARLLVATCHRRGTFAMGGMAAQIPIRGDAHANDEALASVRADKEREVRCGHDGTWVAHPGLVLLARAAFDARMPGPNQIERISTGPAVTERELLSIPAGPRTEAGLRWNLRVAALYVEAWLRGVGCVPLYGRMEDAATAEISRAQVWQWIRHSATLDDARPVTRGLVEQLLRSELASLIEELGRGRIERGRFGNAIALIQRLTLGEEFDEFLTLPAYELLLDRDRAEPV